MSKTIKILAIISQILFTWIYSSTTNYCGVSSCIANSYISFVLILISFTILDLYFLKLYPRFKNIPKNLFSGIILIFPVLFYLCGIILNAITRKPLSVIITSVILFILSRSLWMVLARGKISVKLTEYLAIKSFLLLILGIGFLVANLNFAISSYLKYVSITNDIYIVENKGLKSSFINYKFR